MEQERNKPRKIDEGRERGGERGGWRERERDQSWVGVVPPQRAPAAQHMLGLVRATGPPLSHLLPGPDEGDFASINGGTKLNEKWDF